ncbi:hypothetical protein RF11_02865 [Thelohanellus kitauei]|uniref:Uncharacterized protein n=1 Tax=Thelohanellus kitauei TaxID=669202 RepID=A0A0C2MI92_THEKT|nr:hypothetical protein RF11_02865 [Thelohanellus kitauei]
MDRRVNSTSHRKAKIIYFVTLFLIYVCLIVIETLRVPPMKQSMMSDNFTNFVIKIEQKFHEEELTNQILWMVDINNIFLKIHFIVILCSNMYAITTQPKSKYFGQYSLAMRTKVSIISASIFNYCLGGVLLETIIWGSDRQNTENAANIRPSTN